MVQRDQPMSKERAKKAGGTNRFTATADGATDGAAESAHEGDDAESYEDDAEVRGKDGLTDAERARRRYERRQAQRARSKAKRKKKGNGQR